MDSANRQFVNGAPFQQRLESVENEPVSHPVVAKMGAKRSKTNYEELNGASYDQSYSTNKGRASMAPMVGIDGGRDEYAGHSVDEKKVRRQMRRNQRKMTKDLESSGMENTGPPAAATWKQKNIEELDDF